MTLFCPKCPVYWDLDHRMWFHSWTQQEADDLLERHDALVHAERSAG